MRASGSFFSRTSRSDTRRMKISSQHKDIMDTVNKNGKESAQTSALWAKIYRDGFTKKLSSSAKEEYKPPTVPKPSEGSMMSKPSQSFTEEQWLEKITKLAEKVAKDTKATGKYTWNSEIAALSRQYTAEASPDRMGIINKALDAGTNKKIFYENGIMIASYSSKGWVQYTTAQEDMRTQGFKDLFDKAYTKALELLKGSTNSNTTDNKTNT